jgi:hypothetical protein
MTAGEQQEAVSGGHIVANPHLIADPGQEDCRQSTQPRTLWPLQAVVVVQGQSLAKRTGPTAKQPHLECVRP